MSTQGVGVAFRVLPHSSETVAAFLTTDWSMAYVYVYVFTDYFSFEVNSLVSILKLISS